MITKRDSQIMTRIGEAAKEDSGVMRTIAVVTMFFLPPTFISVGISNVNVKFLLIIRRLFSA